MLKFYNTLTKKKEVFRPRKKGIVKIYDCGPTVYNYAHIGNFRAYIFADLLRRYLEYRGFQIKQVMNITDVGHMTQDEEIEQRGEDKIEAAAKKENKRPEEIARFYEKAFFEDIDTLGVKRADLYPRATEHVREMIQIIKSLIKHKYAYVSNGSVYFDVAKFRKYGQLSGNTIKALEAGARIDVNPEKKNWYDFALWIYNPKHIMQWDAPWSRGYPGWHIECSAMSLKYLGSLDIHTGGEDNIFPHHECEIAQSESYSKKKFVNYWLHTRHLLVNGQKMSKSLGNFYTLRDLLKKGYNPKAIRYLLLSAHYRTRLNFTEQALKAAEKTIESIEEFIVSLRSVRNGKYNNKINEKLKKMKKDFAAAMDDDLNISLALSKIFNFMKVCNILMEKGIIDRENAEDIYNAFIEFDKILGLELQLAASEWLTIDEAPSGIKDLIIRREQYREEKDFAKADGIRKMLRDQYKIILEDTPRGVRWRKEKSH